MNSRGDKEVSTDLFVPIPSEICAARDLTETERLFTLRRLDCLPLGNEPGQFVQVSIFGAEEAPISICSAQRDDDTSFQICVRRIGRLTNALHAMPVGGEVGIRGPFGRGFSTKQLAGGNIVFIAGGIGLPPMRSLIQHCLNNRDNYGNLTLLYGAKKPTELLFQDELNQWTDADGFDVRLIVDFGDDKWTGSVGLITELITPLKIDLDRSFAVLVGPPVMYRFVIEMLRAKGMEPERIFLSLERHMRCGVGKCGHCMIGDLYCCKDGPVMRLSEIMHIEGAF